MVRLSFLMEKDAVLGAMFWAARLLFIRMRST